MSPLPCQCFVGKHVMGQAWVVVVFFMICACKYFFVLCSCKYFFVVHLFVLCFVLVIDLFVFSVGFHWVHTTFVLSLLCSWHWTCTLGLCIFFLHWSSYVFFFFFFFFFFVIFFHLFHYWFVYLYYFSFLSFTWCIVFLFIFIFLFQTLFNCNASLICCFSYCLFRCCHFLIGFCKWFATIFLLHHMVLLPFCLLVLFCCYGWPTNVWHNWVCCHFHWATSTCPWYKSQHSSFGLWWSICKFHKKDWSISTHCNFCNLFFACPLFVNS